MYCFCCNQNYAGILTSLCPPCHKIRHLQSVYGVNRVLEVLQNVLVRDESKQKLKIDTELKTEKSKIESKIITRSRVEKLDRADLMKGC